MALNWAMLNEDRTPVPLPGEETIVTVSSGGELTLVIPDTTPTGSPLASGSEGARRLRAEGRAFLTDQRLIFVANAVASASGLDSLSIPLASLITAKFEQPLLGSNYLAIDIRPSSEGGLTTGTRAELRSKKQPLFQFASTLEKTRERAIYMRRQMQMEEQESLPAYASPSAFASGSGRAGGSTPMDAPPSYDD